MLIDNTAPVTLADGLAVVEQLRELHARSEHNGQMLFAFVFQLAGEALSESLSNADDMAGDHLEAGDVDG